MKPEKRKIVKNEDAQFESQKGYYNEFWRWQFNQNRKHALINRLLEGGILRKCIKEFVISRIKEVQSIESTNRTLKILDLGCGSGWLTRVLSDYGNVVGIDLSIEVASKLYPKLNLKQVNIVTDKIEGKYDIVVSSEVLEHLTSEDQEIYISKAFDILEESGSLILTTPNKRSDEDEKSRKKKLDLQPIENWKDKKSLISLLERQGFKIRFIGSGKFWQVETLKFPKLDLLYAIFYVRFYKILYYLFFKRLESSNKGSTLMVVAQKAKN